MMKFKIVETNFTKKYDWLFRLIADDGEVYFIMIEDFYQRHNIQSPISKLELDYLDKGQYVSGVSQSIETLNVITRIL